MQLVKTCLCGGKVDFSFEFSKIHDLPILKCACGVLHQKINMTAAQHEKYEASAYDHERYDHDKEIAELRMGKHDLWFKGTRLLDVGAGNGAFVDVAREYGLDAWGVERNAAAYKRGNSYLGTLESQRFEAQEFDNITVHDVLERLVDPIAELEEIHRILAVSGMLVVEIPDYYDPSGIHHWRPEHLWFFDKDQCKRTIVRQGFSILKIDKPIPSKTTLYAEKT